MQIQISVRLLLAVQYNRPPEVVATLIEAGVRFVQTPFHANAFVVYSSTTFHCRPTSAIAMRTVSLQPTALEMQRLFAFYTRRAPT